MVVGSLLSYWEGNFSGAMLNFQRVSYLTKGHPNVATWKLPSTHGWASHRSAHGRVGSHRSAHSTAHRGLTAHGSAWKIILCCRFGGLKISNLYIIYIYKYMLYTHFPNKNLRHLLSQLSSHPAAPKSHKFSPNSPNKHTKNLYTLWN